MLRSFRIKTYDEDTGYGLLRHVLVRKGYATGQIMVVPVSYTHLYRVCRNIVCDRIDWNNASKRNSNMNCMLDELEAVSYTHLDVYKRQDWKVFSD